MGESLLLIDILSELGPSAILSTLAMLPVILGHKCSRIHGHSIKLPMTNQLFVNTVGARFYYLRNVLHDFSTPKCISLLQSIIAVMDSESLLLIDEMVIPDAGGVPWQAAQMDLLLMSSFGSLERTREQWEELLEQAGLRTLEVFAYSQSQQESVIVAVPKSRE